MRLSLLVAVAANGVIGRGNDLPWHIPEDLRHFRALTLDRPVIMGRLTHLSILARRGRPLDRRLSITVSSTLAPACAGAGFVVVPGLEAALALAREQPGGESFVIGGAALYRAALPLADRLYRTWIATDVAGDVHFPDWDGAGWTLTESRPGATMAEIDGRPAAYRFEVWDRDPRQEPS